MYIKINTDNSIYGISVVPVPGFYLFNSNISTSELIVNREKYAMAEGYTLNPANNEIVGTLELRPVQIVSPVESMSLNVGEKQSIPVVVNYADLTTVAVKISDPSKVDVGYSTDLNQHYVLGKEAGECTVVFSANADPSKSATISIKVNHRDNG